MSSISLLAICLAAVSMMIAAESSNLTELVGTPDEIFDTRVVNGNVAGTNQFPWQATVFVRRGKSSTIFCSGALLSRHTVLTHADCLARSTQAWVLLGSTTFHRGLRVNVARFNIHPRFFSNNNRHQFFNIAVLRLATIVPLSRNIQTIALPPQKFEGFAFQNQTARFSGFGSNCK